jgi:transcriptional regulator with XRE-family HTH domain
MNNPDYVDRLNKVFGNASMAEVARRLEVPHATVQNYYRKGRLPATEVLIKIAEVTNVSLNWLLTGKGDMYAIHRPPMGLGQFIEEKIGEMIEQRVAGISGGARTPAASAGEFDVAEAVLRLDDPSEVMRQWLQYEGREYPEDYGVVFFRGWESFSTEEKIEAIKDAKRVLDRSLRP